MKSHKFSFFYSTIILIIIFQLSYSSNESIPVYKVKRIILTDSINNFNSPYNIRCDIESKGYGVTFNYNSNISLIPYNLFERLFEFYKSYEDIYTNIMQLDNGIKELIIYANIEYGFETIHFIFEKFGISIPLQYYLVDKEEIQKFGIRFLSKEDQQYISFGKDLIDVMNIEIKDDNSFIVNNDDFISKMDD